MYFLVRGVISVEKMILDNNTKEWSNQKIADLQAGSYFGELALLLKPKPGLKGQRRAASCIAVTDCDARLLNKTIFNQVCDDFPELRLYLQAEADRKYAMYSDKTAEELKADREKANRITSMKATLSTSKVATLGSLQSTLDSINTRMTRLEVNMGRLQAKGGIGGSGSGGGGARGSQLNNVQPPTTVATGSNGRRYITSPPITTAAKVGWKSVRKVVVPETTTPTTPTTTTTTTTTTTPSSSISSITTKSMLSNSRWGSPTHASAGAVVSSPTHTKESLSAMERAIEEAHKHATAAQERQKASPSFQTPFQNDQSSPSKMLSNRRWG